MSNLAVPGLGSLVAGRRAGYPQLVIYLAGFALTSLFGVRFFLWYFSDSGRLLAQQGDPTVFLREIWLHVRWAALGIGLFVISMAWALITSLLVVREAKRNAP